METTEHIVNTQKYYPINKTIIDEEVELFFNLYGKTSSEKELSLISTKNRKLVKHDVDNLLDYNLLYVHEDEKELYENYYNNLMSLKLVPEKMKEFYSNVGNTINKMFTNPQDKSNMKEVDNIVTEMVSTIAQNSFTVSSFITILSSDYYNHTHSLNVSVYAICLGRHLKMKKSELKELGVSALLHDLGKSKISDAIINKTSKLTEHEFNEVKKHSMYGWALARQMGITNKHILAGIRNHHERMDGNGYPDRLKDEQIHIFAKIIAVCDTFDALTTNKSYQDSMGTFNTLLMMKKEMSKHLDTTIVDHFINIFREESISNKTT
jgi:HD-GYP domain-containing protein (c-di-GMP phosphodiesterase class II)